jgi:LysM repeat protein
MNEQPEKASFFIVFLMLFLLTFFYLVLGVTSAYAQPAEYKMSRNEYVEKFKDDAVKEMLTNGVPASITLAQGMLESDNGNSALAVYANNHFGIKCHTEWTGSTFIQDDDEKDECFRKYPHVLESYSDHSLFLRTRPRYAFLFEAHTIDYKVWASGLKSAGYATDPRYADKLIQLIEDNGLSKFDSIGELPNIQSFATIKKNAIKPTRTYEVLKNNKRKCLVVKPGDTFYSIAEHFKVEMYDLYKYNDCDEHYVVRAGSNIYLEPKKKKGDVQSHLVKKGDTMHSISQQYGVKLKSLYKYNHIKRGITPVPGEKIYLVKKKRSLPE